MKDTLKSLGAIAFVLIVISFIIAGPLITIFAVNTLFAAGWAYSLANWFSVLWLQMIVYGIGRAAKTKG